MGTSKITGGRGGAQGSHNKPIGCGASGAYAPGPDEEEEEESIFRVNSCTFKLQGSNSGTRLTEMIVLFWTLSIFEFF